MKENSGLPRRKHPRLKNYDYTQANSYFLTICSANHENIFGKVYFDKVENGPVNVLSDSGKIVDKYIKSIPCHYDNVTVDNYIVMPNHVHLLITLYPADGVTVSVSDIVKSLKSLVTKEIGRPVWQTSFYDKVIDDQTTYENVWNYILENNTKWLLNRGFDY